jgi:hypothetical protein
MLRKVSSPDNEDTLGLLKAVQFDEELVQRLLALVLPHFVSHMRYCVDLIYEDYAWLC